MFVPKRKLTSESSALSDAGYVLGIDQSYNGFAMVHMSVDGIWHRDIRMPPFKSTGVTRLADIDRWFIQRCMELDLGLGLGLTGALSMVCMEDYARGRNQGREEAGELGAVVKLRLYHYGIFPTIVSPPTLKKFVTGSGKAQKSDVKLNVYKRWGVEYTDDNLADAYGLARAAAALLHPETVTKEQYATLAGKVRSEKP